MAFPVNPKENEIFSSNGKKYLYDSNSKIWKKLPSGISDTKGAPSPTNKIWTGTREEYKDIKIDPKTLYFIKE